MTVAKRCKVVKMWIKHSEQKPEVGQKVFYYFDQVGVHRGEYYGESDLGGVYGGKGGFLNGDVTHWMPDTGQKTAPEPPN